MKSGLPLISDAMWKMRPSTTLGISQRSSWSRERLPSPVSSQGRQAFVTLHLCVFSSAAIISAGGPPLFLLLPSPTGLLSLKAAVSSILLSASLYPVLLSKLQHSLSCSTFIYNVIIRRQLSSLSSLCEELISPHRKLSFPHLG